MSPRFPGASQRFPHEYDAMARGRRRGVLLLEFEVPGAFFGAFERRWLECLFLRSNDSAQGMLAVRMNAEILESALVSAMSEIFSPKSFVYCGAMTWKRRALQGIETISIHLCSPRHLPSGVHAFSCTFSQCNFQIWPVVMADGNYLDFGSTIGSSIFYLKGSDDGKLLDVLRRGRVRAGEYGFSNELTLEKSVEKFLADFNSDVLPFFAKTADYMDLLGMAENGDARWWDGVNERLLIAVTALGNRSKAQQLFENREVKSNFLGAVVGGILRPGAGQKVREGRRTAILAEFINSSGAGQEAIDEAAKAALSADYSSAIQLLDSVPEGGPNYDFAALMKGVVNNRFGRLEKAGEELSRVAGGSSIYRELATTFLAKVMVDRGEKNEARRCVEIMNDIFFETNGYKGNYDAKKLSLAFF